MVLMSLSLFACTYQSDDRCDENEVLYGDTRCVCAAGFVMTAHGCAACGEHEVASATGCVCADGYTRPAAQSACQAKTGGQGDACDAQTPCSDPAYGHCQSGGAAGYCTSTGCATSADCTSGYACDTAASPSFCKRPPVGAGKSCSSAADCADTEATYCDTFVSHACLVQGCTVAPNNCFAGSQCCDLSGFGVPQPICIPGMCP